MLSEFKVHKYQTKDCVIVNFIYLAPTAECTQGRYIVCCLATKQYISTKNEKTVWLCKYLHIRPTCDRVSFMYSLVYWLLRCLNKKIYYVSFQLSAVRDVCIVIIYCY